MLRLPLTAVVRDRHAAQEATYESMSAGATAPAAGEIAKNLTHDSCDAELKTVEQAARETTE